MPSPTAEVRAERLARAREEARAILRARAAEQETADTGAKDAAEETAPKPDARQVTGNDTGKDLGPDGGSNAGPDADTDPGVVRPSAAKAHVARARKAAKRSESKIDPDLGLHQDVAQTDPNAAEVTAPDQDASTDALSELDTDPDAADVPEKPARKSKRKRKRRANRAARRAARAAREAEAAVETPPPVSPSRPQGRHRAVIVGFFLMVVAPIAVTAWYLWALAADQYVSDMGFTVRREEAASPTDILGGLTNFSSAASSDTDVLYEYIQSQELVRRIDEALDLRQLYSVHHATDPVFAFDPDGSIEDLVGYWRRMVQISYNPGSGMLELRAFAFSPDQAQAIAEEILKNSSSVINDLSAIAREDATRYAREDLESAQNNLKAAREALTAFRSRTRIIDPAADLQSQMGILTTLQAQLAEAIIELDLLRETTSDDDARVVRALRRIEVIEDRIDEERSKFSQGGAIAAGEEDYATLVAEFERLNVDREFAEQTYVAALSAFAGARAEAERQSRYLAPYVRPTLAETATHPQRIVLLGLVTLFLTLAWAIVVLIYYSLRDRQ